MLSHLSIRRFRGFRELATTPGPVTAFLGPNSSGKTTVLQAIRLACDLLRAGLAVGRRPALKEKDGKTWVIVTDAEVVTDHTSLLLLADRQALFLDQEYEEGSALAIELELTPENLIRRLVVELVCGRGRQLELTVKLEAPELLARVGFGPVPERSPKRSPRRLSTAEVEELREAAPLAVLVPPFYGTVLGEEFRVRAAVDRLLGTGDQRLVVRSLIASLTHEEFELLNGFLLDLVGAKLSYRTSGDAIQTESPLVVRFRDSNGDLEISAAGAGIVNLVSIFAVLARWRREGAKRSILYLMDEPEAHLHPRLQAESAERLAWLVTREFRAQLVLATHSVDILNRLSEGGAALRRCDRNANPSVVELGTDSALFADLGQWADLTPYTAINFLASRRILFCEGDEDIRLLSELAQLRFRNQPLAQQRFRRWALVRLKGAENRNIAELLMRLIRSEAVRAGGDRKTFEVVVVLDRDHSRQPGQREQQVDFVHETEIVWSRHSLESLLCDPEILITWSRAFLGEQTPADLENWILAAIQAADVDSELCAAAGDQLALRLIQEDVQPGESRDSRMIRAMRQARELVAKEPAVWQRGKDRSRFILGRIREQLPAAARNQFPTDIVRLVQRADTQRIALGKAIPDEVLRLFDSLIVP